MHSQIGLSLYNLATDRLHQPEIRLVDDIYKAFDPLNANIIVIVNGIESDLGSAKFSLLRIRTALTFSYRSLDI